MIATWYVLEDGSVADPAEVRFDDVGVLRHRDGRIVAMRGDVPRTRSVDVAHHAKPLPAGDALKTVNQTRAATGLPPVPSQEPARDVVRDELGLPPASEDEAETAARDMQAEKPKRGYRTRDSKAD